jgi:hypothetical protein
MESFLERTLYAKFAMDILQNSYNIHLNQIDPHILTAFVSASSVFLLFVCWQTYRIYKYIS